MHFSQRNCNYPQPKYATWWLSQFRRWGMVDAAPDYDRVAKQVMLRGVKVLPTNEGNPLHEIYEIARRINGGWSMAETTTTGTAGYCARM